MIRRIALFVFVINFTIGIFGQEYEVCVENPELVTSNIFEFDVCINSVSETFELTSYQCAFTYYSKITNGGNLSFTYIPGSSNLNSIPNFGVGINNSDGINKLTFASMPGSNIIDTTKKKIGRFRLENSSPFGPYLSRIINLTWNFEGFVSTILTGPNFNNITNPVNHVSGMDGLSKLNIAQSVASDTSTLINHPGKTFDGLGFYDTDLESKWTALPTPQWIIYDLGINQNINLTRFSFGSFNVGRKYIYSVFLSSDNINWNEVVTNDTSELIEYTENIFEPQNARYVKLLIISNSQNNWATLWEADIWGGDGMVPVELSSFTGLIENDRIILNWKTESELNNKGFNIERKTGNEDFEKIYFIPGQGTSTNSFLYTFTDINLKSGNYTYRLKQIDYDGSFSYSNILDFEINNFVNDYQLEQNYPNPFNPTTNIQFSLKEKGSVIITIFNILGEKIDELINKELSEGKYSIEFDASNLPSGTYIYSMNIKNKYLENRKMVLIK
ncbi:MAG TPA: discoidin domain-containing protein [Ignavibacteriaceae bacterium]|nr:discoidin domain-containing protein [Ignavibacteriaceae bacterium]